MSSTMSAYRSTPSPLPDLARTRLPTLFEVLYRRSLPPVDLYAFYIYMRDQQRSVDYLDFWLDVSQHMSLCRHYVRELRRSVMIGTPDLEKSGSKRSSMLLDNMGDLDNYSAAGPSTQYNEKERSQDRQMSKFLREDVDQGHHAADRSSMDSEFRRTNSYERNARPSYALSDSRNLTTDSNSPAHAVTRSDIKASAVKILYTFLLPDAERQILLPQNIVAQITHSIEEDHRDDPEVFDMAKDYVFQAMERDAFPGFLRMRALGNLVPPSMMMRLILGLLALFGGFWAAFILIFLDKDRATRCWLILPFTLGVYALASHQYGLDPILGLLGFSEYSFGHFTRIKEPYVRSLINKRSVTVLLVTIAVTTALCILFIFVPGKRL